MMLQTLERGRSVGVCRRASVGRAGVVFVAGGSVARGDTGADALGKGRLAGGADSRRCSGGVFSTSNTEGRRGLRFPLPALRPTEAVACAEETGGGGLDAGSEGGGGGREATYSCKGSG